MNYSIIGLGKLGASMAAAVASRGFNVVGVDVNKQAVELVNAGHAPAQETNLEETVAANRTRIRATESYEDALGSSDVSFVIVPTPSDDRGAFSLQFAAWAFKEIGRAIAKKGTYHLVVLTSTVLPGATRYGLLPILEKESGKKCGKDFGLCYSPEFIALGSVIRDFLHPDFTLVGEFDSRSGALLEKAYAEIMPDRPPCMRMSLENAELTKISVNTFITTKITFANMLAELCEKIPGGDIDVVTKALGRDTRIGQKYLAGGLGYGGPCFPRDNKALGFIARELGGSAGLAEVTDAQNRSMPNRVLESLKGYIRRGATVAVLGLSYKPHSHVIEESQGIVLAKRLSKLGARVVAYDPLAGTAARTELTDQAVVLDSISSCLQQADVVLVTTADPAFRAIKADDFKKDSVTVIDFWRILEKELSGRSNVTYVPFGKNTSEAAGSAKLKSLWRTVNEENA
jgi:UDPglucose 6-dehydrogenase